MWMEPTRSALTSIETAETESSAFNALIQFSIAVGADLVSYHHSDNCDQLKPKPEKTSFSLFSYGFPSDWVEKYQSTHYHKIDPITAHAAHQTRAVYWSDIPNRVKLSQDQKDYIQDLYRWLSPGDGLAIPLFGPSGRHGYGSIDWRKSMPAWDAVTRRVIQSVFESFHLRICELRLCAMEQDFELSDTEKQLLTAIIQGVPDAIICDRLDMRSHDLRIAMNRLMTKMRVSDRPSAIVRAKALGLVNP